MTNDQVARVLLRMSDHARVAGVSNAHYLGTHITCILTAGHHITWKADGRRQSKLDIAAFLTAVPTAPLRKQL
jgi:hypothetical protein